MPDKPIPLSLVLGPAQVVAAFVRAECETGDFLTLKEDLHAAYVTWAAERKRAPRDLPAFGRYLLKLFPDVCPARVRQDDGKRKWVYHGIRLKAPPLQTDGY